MESHDFAPGDKSGPSDPNLAPAVTTIENERNQNRFTPIEPYPSPASSLIAPSVRYDTDLDTLPKTSLRALKETKTAKDYWKLVYASLGLRGSGKEDKKRKQNDVPSDDNDSRLKRRRLMCTPDGPSDTQSVETASTVCNDETIAAKPELVGLGTKQYLFCRHDGREDIRELEKAIDPADAKAVQDFRLLREATFSFGWDKCKGEAGKWKLPNFKTALFPHQVVGVRWMVGRELHPLGPKGGILADEMGLGKTVQLLACMSQNPPARKAMESKTLIIAPRRLHCQWQEEIMAHYSDKSVFRYTASQVEDNRHWDHFSIILTSYEQVQMQIPGPAQLREIEQLRQAMDKSWMSLLRANAGPLFQVDWYRVVLDEAHFINNRNSKTSRACRLLVSRYRWALTGTPMTNSPEEFFPYLDFLRTEYNSFGRYQDAMGDVDDETRNEKMRAAYHEITLGRRSKDQFMGKPILAVPEPEPPQVIAVEFSPIERAFYQKVLDTYRGYQEQRSIAGSGVSKPLVAKGEMAKLFHTLRFSTSHLALVQPDIFANQTAEGGESIPPDTAPATTFHCYCRICRKVLDQPHTGSCGHVFCRRCVTGKRKCVTCGTVVTADGLKPAGDDCYRPIKPGRLRRFLNQLSACSPRKPGDDEFGLQPTLSSRRVSSKPAPRGARGKGMSRAQLRRRKAKKRKKKDLTDKVRDNTAKFLRVYDRVPWNPIPHSAKTKAAMELVRQWNDEAPDDKIIIFGYWIATLSILGRMLFQNGIRFVYLWGDMEKFHQQRCIKAFQNIPEIKVMLISVSCGAHGLNLTVANRAIVLEHWWNKSLEEQAFARINRIGQVKKIHTAKIVVKDSTDDHVMKIQSDKQEDIAAAIQRQDGVTKEEDPFINEFLDMVDRDSQFDSGMLAAVADMSDDDSSSTDDEDEDESDDDDHDEGDNDDSDGDGDSSNDTDAGSDYELS
ncbi:hypothetical protein VTK26DRAFT_4301 [Humicola hyalothermophila]